MALRFTTTNWTRIGEAEQDHGARSALAEQYHVAVREYILILLRDEEAADDLAQQFIIEKFLTGSFLQRTDRSRGRFRSLLTTAIRHFVYDALRSSGRHRANKLPDVNQLSAGDFERAERAHDYEFAQILLSQAIEQTRVACIEQGMDRQWRAFEARILNPARSGCEQTDVDALIDELDVTDRQKVYTMSDTVRKKVLRSFRQLFSTFCEDADEVSDEMNYLLSCLETSSTYASATRRWL